MKHKRLFAVMVLSTALTGCDEGTASSSPQGAGGKADASVDATDYNATPELGPITQAIDGGNATNDVEIKFRYPAQPEGVEGELPLGEEVSADACAVDTGWGPAEIQGQARQIVEDALLASCREAVIQRLHSTVKANDSYENWWDVPVPERPPCAFLDKDSLTGLRAVASVCSASDFENGWSEGITAGSPLNYDGKVETDDNAQFYANASVSFEISYGLDATWGTDCVVASELPGFEGAVARTAEAMLESVDTGESCTTDEPAE